MARRNAAKSAITGTASRSHNLGLKYAEHVGKDGYAGIASGDFHKDLSKASGSGQGVVNYSGKGRQMTPVNANKVGIAASARKRKLDRGEELNEPPPMRGNPSHFQYGVHCQYNNLKCVVTHDGYVVYHPGYWEDANTIRKHKLEKKDYDKFGVPEDFVFEPEGPEQYNNPGSANYDWKKADEIRPVEQATVASQPDNSVTLNQDQFAALMNRITALEEEKAALEEKNPPKKYNNYVQRMINKGDIGEHIVNKLYEAKGSEIVKADIDEYFADLDKVTETGDESVLDKYIGDK